MYEAFTPNTERKTYQFRSLAALCRRLGGDGYQVEHESAFDPGSHRTIAVTRTLRGDSARSVITTLRVPVEALDDEAADDE